MKVQLAVFIICSRKKTQAAIAGDDGQVAEKGAPTVRTGREEVQNDQHFLLREQDVGQSLPDSAYHKGSCIKFPDLFLKGKCRVATVGG